MFWKIVLVIFSIDESRSLRSVSAIKAFALFHQRLFHRPVLSLYHLLCRTSAAVWVRERASAWLVGAKTIDTGVDRPGLGDGFDDCEELDGETEG